MANRIWNIDGEETVGSVGAVIKWDDNRFFTLSYDGQDFHGEILEEKYQYSMNIDEICVFVLMRPSLLSSRSHLYRTTLFVSLVSLRLIVISIHCPGRVHRRLVSLTKLHL